MPIKVATPKLDIVNARLVVMPPPIIAAPQQTSSEEPPPPEPENSQPIAKPLQEIEIAAAEMDVQQVAPEPVPADVVEPKVESMPPITTPDDIAASAEPINNEQWSELTTTHPDASRVTQLTRRHFQQLNQNQVANMAQQAAQEFQQRKNSPMIPATVEIDKGLSEDEKLMKSLEVNVNCSSVASQATTILTSLLGGNLKCTQGPDIASYVNARVNKAPAKPTKK